MGLVLIPTVAGLGAPASHGGPPPTFHVIGTRARRMGEPLPHAGQLTITRAARSADLDLVNAMHVRCSIASQVARYQSAMPLLSTGQWRHLVDPGNGGCWVTHQPDTGDVIAVTHLTRFQAAPEELDLGILVEDGWQRHGLGWALTWRALEWARARGYCAVRAMTSQNNAGMQTILRRAHACVTSDNGATADWYCDLTSSTRTRGAH